MDPDDIRDDKNLTVTIGSTPPAPEYKYESDATYTISGESFAGGISTPSFTYSTEFADTGTIDSSFGLDLEMCNTIQSWPDEYESKNDRRIPCFEITVSKILEVSITHAKMTLQERVTMLFDFSKNRKRTIYDRTGKTSYPRWYIFHDLKSSHITLHSISK